MVLFLSWFGGGYYWVFYLGDLCFGWCFIYQQCLFDKFLLCVQLFFQCFLFFECFLDQGLLFFQGGLVLLFQLYWLWYVGYYGGRKCGSGCGQSWCYSFFCKFYFQLLYKCLIYGCKIVYYLCMKILFVYVYFVSICVQFVYIDFCCFIFFVSFVF